MQRIAVNPRRMQKRQDAQRFLKAGPREIRELPRPEGPVAAPGRRTEGLPVHETERARSLAEDLVPVQLRGGPRRNERPAHSSTGSRDARLSSIANVAPIYTADRPSGNPRQLAPIELIHCRFERGATVLKTSFGIEYRELSIRRDDMRAAIAILKGARVDFGKRK